MKPNESANCQNSFELNCGPLSDTRRYGIPERVNTHFNFTVTVCIMGSAR